MSEQEPDAPTTGQEDPVVEVREATDRLTPEEVREAQQERRQEEEGSGA